MSKNKQPRAIKLDLPDEDAAMALVHKIAAKMTGTLVIMDADGNKLAEVQGKRKLDS